MIDLQFWHCWVSFIDEDRLFLLGVTCDRATIDDGDDDDSN